MAEHIQEWGQKNTQVQLQGRSYSRTEEPGLKKWSRKWQKSIRGGQKNRGGNQKKKKKKTHQHHVTAADVVPETLVAPLDPEPSQMWELEMLRWVTMTSSCALTPLEYNIRFFFFSCLKRVASQTKGHSSTFGSSSVVIRFCDIHIEVTLLFICFLFF